ncbi:MAG: 3'(2'),5'-bisphosphate nucleotidase CysQ [Acidobacteria bacterium]|nr:3'(2'),5'-bisphosphate nucleotidase CysQ [Acidobacteriota bacterium]
MARDLAAGAGAVLLTARTELVAAGADERTIKDAGDRRSHEWLMEQLATLRPADAVLSEEGKDDPARLGFSRVWIIDPLDGTREFSEIRDDWAVHVALAIDGAPTVGAVALPGLELVLSTAEPPVMAPRPAGRPVQVVVSRTRPPAIAVAVAEELGGELVPMGSAGAKAMAVVRGEVDVYVHGGGQYEWDNCAPAAVALAAGLHVSRLDGSPLRYNNPDPYLPDLVICRPELAAEVLRIVAGSA